MIDRCLRKDSSRCDPSTCGLGWYGWSHNSRSPSSHTCQPYGFLLFLYVEGHSQPPQTGRHGWPNMKVQDHKGSRGDWSTGKTSEGEEAYHLVHPANNSPDWYAAARVRQCINHKSSLLRDILIMCTDMQDG